MTSFMMQYKRKPQYLHQNNLMHNDYDYLFKLILVGQSSVGKSCLLLRFLESRFKNQHEPTLGVQFGAKIVPIDEHKIKLQVWDTAGQESFRSITRAYYRGSIAALLVFDLSSLTSFDSLVHWLREVKTNSHSKLRLCLIGNKSDLTAEREVSEQAIQEFLKTHSIKHYFQTSALTGENSSTPFLEMGRAVLEAIEQKIINPEEDGALGVKQHPRRSTGVSPAIKSLSDIREKEQRQEEQERCAC